MAIGGEENESGLKVLPQVSKILVNETLPVVKDAVQGGLHTLAATLSHRLLAPLCPALAVLLHCGSLLLDAGQTMVVGAVGPLWVQSTVFTHQHLFHLVVHVLLLWTHRSL